MDTLKICFLFLFVCIAANCKARIPAMKDQQMVKPLEANKKLTVLDYDKLLYVKENLNSNRFSSLYKDLLQSANKALKEGPFNVMQKTQTPPSGDKHDYISLGPYWWPDQNKPDGLPWIRRDGEVNPLTREGSTDFEAKNKMFHNTNSLAMAYFFSDKKEYANKVIELLSVWFLNEETKMNPNLNFAQGIPGKNTGRGIGIIEFRGLTNIISAIEILELNRVLDQETSKNLRLWFTNYLIWLQTSKNGLFEKNTKNNHATHYDVQIVSILLFLKREEEARQVLEVVKMKRISKQIHADGKQPHELARTKSLSYSTMNLRGFTQLAYLGTKVDVDLWNYKADNGASIVKAYEFLKPYAEEKKEWSYKQLGNIEKAKKSLKQLFIMAGSQFNIQEYCKIGSRGNNKNYSLIYYCN